MTIEIPFPLVEGIRNKRASLFLGAGTSMEAGFPNGDELAQYLTQQAGEPYTELLQEQPLDAVAQILYMKAGYGTQWVRQKIIEHFETLHKQAKRPPSEGHATMTTVEWRSIFTTNYDRLVEIAYDSNNKSVQRILPIYEPDIQIHRRQPEVVRIIKLNGSVDEAQRNSSHHLVVTFAEQQDARSRNQDFYQLLREEAVNGPIVFLGFQFVHPGARVPASSPEFQILRDILHEMGPAARWHYCVTPFDSQMPEAQMMTDMLRANKIEMINGTFGEFMKAAHDTVHKTATAIVDRPSIAIPIGHSSVEISADEYDIDKKYFEIITPRLHTEPIPSINESLNGGATWASFFDRHYIKRTCAEDFKQVVRTRMAKSSDVLCLVAPIGWGKTFLLSDLAVNLSTNGVPVFWLNPYSTLEFDSGAGKTTILGKWDSTRIDRLLGMIADKAEANKIGNENSTAIIIVDNVPERSDEVLALMKALRENNRRFLMIFALRDHDYDAIKEQNPLVGKFPRFTPSKLYDTKEEIRELVKFCDQRQIGAIEGQNVQEIIVQKIMADEADVALIFALQVIFDREHRPFSQIVKGLWESLEHELSQTLVSRVVALHRFGSNYSPRLYSILKTFPAHEQAKALDACRECTSKGILLEFLVEDEPCIATIHPLVAQKIVQMSGYDNVHFDDELIRLVSAM